MPGTDENGGSTDVGEVIDLVKTYAVQETVGPLKDMGRWLAFGLAGVILLSIGMLLLLLGLLRVLQTETSAFEGNWSFVPYLITLVVAVIVIVIALSRIKKLEFEAGEPRS